MTEANNSKKQPKVSGDNGVARLRERFYEIKKKIKITPELEDAVREKQPTPDEDSPDQDQPKKIASPKPRTDLDL